MSALRDQERGCDSRTDAQAKGQRGGMPGREPTAVLTRCPFKDEYAGHTQLTASRQALSSAKQQQYDRGKHANDCIARQKSDGRSSSSHQHNDGNETARRPRRSAIRPKSTAPTGLMISAVPYTANAASSTVEGSSAGKTPAR